MKRFSYLNVDVDAHREQVNMDYEEKMINGKNMISFKGVWYPLGDFLCPGNDEDDYDENAYDEYEDYEDPLDYESDEEVYDMLYLE